MTSIRDMNLVFVDVEATGASPMTGRMTEFGAVHYRTCETFHGLLYDSTPDPENPAKPVITPGSMPYPPLPVALAFTSWLASFSGRPIFVSDNNGYDAMWVTCFFDGLGLRNPFGHSSRRISDFYAGLVGDFSQTQKWKRHRITPHTHHPVDDAMGNAEAFAHLLEVYPQR